MNANPLPVAEFLAPAPGNAPASPGVAPPADLPNPADARAAATFAALLQSAGLAADASAADESGEAQRAEPPEEVSEAPTQGSALEGLLFLAHVQATAPAPGATAQANASSPSVETAPESAPRLAALVPRLGVDRAGAALVPPVDDTGRVALPAASVGMPSAEPAARPPRGALRFDLDPVANASSEPVGERSAPKSDPLAFILPSLENAKRQTGEALGAETKLMAAASPPDPTLSITTPANAPLSAPAPFVVDIDTPVTDPAWRGEVAGRLATFVSRGVDHAELRLSPAELGPVEVRIDMRGGEATLAIVATHATTRDALEQALPLLRDMLAQQGLSLGEATVRDGRPDDQANRNERATPRGGNETRTEAIDTDMLPAPRPGLVRRLVDVFA